MIAYCDAIFRIFRSTISSFSRHRIRPFRLDIAPHRCEEGLPLDKDAALVLVDEDAALVFVDDDGDGGGDDDDDGDGDGDDEDDGDDDEVDDEVEVDEDDELLEVHLSSASFAFR